MRKIKIPDGSIVGFPDDFTDDDIRGILREKFPSSQRPPVAETPEAQALTQAIEPQRQVISPTIEPRLGIAGIPPYMSTEEYDITQRPGDVLQERLERPTREPETIEGEITTKGLASYIPSLTLKALQGLIHPLLAPLGGTRFDTNKLIADAIEYWEEKTPEVGALPDVGLGISEKGKIRLEKRKTRIKDLLGMTAQMTGALAGPVRYGLKAGELVTTVPQIAARARPFYRSILKGMIGGSLIGEGDPQQTLQDMALFGVFEPIAYGIGKISAVPTMIRESTPWRKMTIKERGLILQSLDDVIQKNPNITEGKILRKWDNPQWRKEALKRYVAPKKEVPTEPIIPPEPEVKPSEVTKKAPRIEEVPKEVGKIVPEGWEILDKNTEVQKVWRAQYGADATIDLLKQKQEGYEKPDIKRALKYQEEAQKQRKAEKEYAFSEEGKKEAERIEIERAEQEKAVGKKFVEDYKSEYDSLADGQILTQEGEATVKVVKSAKKVTFWQLDKKGQEVKPFAVIKEGVADVSARDILKGLRDGFYKKAKPKEVAKPTTAELEARMAAAMEKGEAKVKAEAPPLKEPGGIPNFTERAKASRTEPTPEAYKWAGDATKEQYEALKKERAKEGERLQKLSDELARLPKGPERQKLAGAKSPRDFELSFKGEALEAYETIHGLRKRDPFKVDQIEKALGIKLPEVKPKEVKPAVVKEPHKMSQKEFIDYHATGTISEQAYKQYETLEGVAWLGKKEKYPIKIKSQKYGDEVIELRKSDKKLQYVKQDKEGNIVRDKKGLATYMTEQEMKQLDVPLTETSIVAFNSKGQPIGWAANEFGADGVWVINQYQKRGIGNDLLTELRKQFKPTRKMGQMTGSGLALVKAHHRRLVKQAISEGKITSHPDYLELGKKIIKPPPKAEVVGKKADLLAEISEAVKEYPEVKPPAKEVKKYVNMMIREVETGQPPTTIKYPGEYEKPEYRRLPSDYPEFMRRKGWTGKEVVTALKKGVKGEKLGIKQQVIYDAAKEYGEARYRHDKGVILETFPGFQKMYESWTARMKKKKARPKQDIKIFDTGKIVKQRTNKARSLISPPVFEAELNVVKRMPELRPKPLGGWLENPIRTFEELGSDAKELYYRPIKQAEHRVALERKALNKRIKTLRKGISSRSRRRIGAYATAQQPRGKAIIQAMGVGKVPELKPKEMKVYNALRQEFENFYIRLNEARRLSGKEQFGKVENYFTFIRDLGLLNRMGFNPTLDKLSAINQAFIHLKTTPFRFAKARVKLGVMPIELDAFQIFEQYASTAVRHIHLSPVIAKLREFALTFGTRKVPVKGLSYKEAEKFANPEKEYVLDELYERGHIVNKDGTVTLYHATTKERAPEIQKTGFFRTAEGAPDAYGVYFSTSPEVRQSYGDGTLLKVKVKLNDLNPDDVFPATGRMDFQVNTKQGIYKPAEIAPEVPAIPRFLLREEKPRTAKFLTEWLDFQAGQRPPTSMPRVIEKGLMKINQNLTFAILSANIRSALIQPSALVNTVAEIGPKYTLEGIMSLFSPKIRKFVMDKSNLLTRDYDVAVVDAMAAIRAGRIGELKKAVGRKALKPLQLLDMETAKATWYGAYLKAKKEGSYAMQKAINYANDVVTRTQGSAAPSDVAPIQRTALGKAISLFQTFVINQWGFLTRDVLGVKNPKMKNTARLKKLLGFLGGAIMLNIFYEDLLGINSPLPTPIKAFNNAIEEGEELPSATLRIAKEVVEVVPIVGGGLRYGKGILGATAETIQELAKGNKPVETALKLYGLPGVVQAGKMKRAAKRGETPYGIWVGKYTPKHKRKKKWYIEPGKED